MLFETMFCFACPADVYASDTVRVTVYTLGVVCPFGGRQVMSTWLPLNALALNVPSCGEAVHVYVS